MKRPAVDVLYVKGGRPVCGCHGWSVRFLTRRDGSRVTVHCEHPERYVIYGDGYIPDYCEACGWRASPHPGGHR
jgi:hypothetical protein